MSRPKMAKSKRRAALAVYLPTKVMDQLKDVATKDRRSASTQALIYIERGLESIGAKPRE